MRIKTMSVYTAELKYAGETYAFAGGRSYQSFTSTILMLETDTGLRGYGEVCPCGPSYMPAFAEGLPACLKALAPSVLGEDPRQLTRITQRMDQALNGHGYAKAAIDIACWDLLGKAADLPVHTLLGGMMSPSLPLHRIVPLSDPEAMSGTLQEYRDAGFRHFQIKLGHAVEEDIALMVELADGFQADEVWVGDINGAWRRDEVLRFSHALADIDMILEQPCASYDECLSVRRRIQHPVKLDESLNSLGEVQRALRDDAMDAMSLKVSKFGGLTRARVIRDVCVDAGIPITFEDAWGSGIATAAFAHLAVSTEERGLLNATDLHNYNTTQLAEGAPVAEDGRMTVSDRPGLGVEPDFDLLGEPVLQF
ncbi:mandelate racemase/muconate lactonizing enzyme family protein [Marinobacter nanhaiticus D15-8W]|uniref:Mandelate racemase n=1 Tax=Marinobacter nanhaiticus D15-8W TaxID=626887 RepID=N6VRN9_9GAMM|nr:mandelate racemase/muconate lactonizing enzyme family protein [Marinobacter nanhaiticus]ENO12855.1 mandelate racemase [Marinobacter nanhaiticus D15-8W]BES70205.1 mandelate racemase/muconate lactonizing enzyme family protein [Marinobacter nanhaiticus D15-8W]